MSVAISCACNIRRSVKLYDDHPDGNAGEIGPDFSEWLAPQISKLSAAVRNAERLWREVEYDILAVADGECAHRIVYEYVVHISFIFIHCVKNDGTSITAIPNLIEEHGAQITDALLKTEDVDLRSICERMSIEMVKADQNRRRIQEELPPLDDKPIWGREKGRREKGTRLFVDRNFGKVLVRKELHPACLSLLFAVPLFARSNNSITPKRIPVSSIALMNTRSYLIQ